MVNSTANDESRPSGPRSQILGSRHSLLAPRMVIGVALVALAAAGTFAASTGALNSKTQSVVVAARDLAPGSRIESEDLQTAQMDLGSAGHSSVASNHSQLVGLVVLGPVGSGELIQASNVVRKASDLANPEISFAIPSARAVGGSLTAGEIVDVVATDKAGGESGARVVVSGAQVVSMNAGNDQLGSNGDVVVTLTVADTAKAAEVAGAVDSGNVTLVRTTGLSK